MDSQWIAEVTDVNRDYGKDENSVRVLKNANLGVGKGEFIAIVGPSGSGKSTLLNLLGALDRPTSGVVKIAGRDLEQESDNGLAEIRNKYIGFVFQFHHLLPEFNAIENVLFPRRIARGRLDKSDEIEATTLLEKVGLGEKLKSRPSDLSGGQQQRVAIARALAGGKSLILADEPTGNLDTQTGLEVFEIMRSFNKNQSVSFIIVTHDEDLANKADRIVRVINGEVTGGVLEKASTT